jgi:hypothetical protein
MGNSSTGRPPKRSWRVTLFSLAVLLLGGGLNLARAAWAWRQADALADLPEPTSMPMTLLAATSLAWGLVFVVCSLGLWRLRPWGRRGTLGAVTLYHVHIWVNHALFDRSDFAKQVAPSAIAQTLVTLLVVWGFLYWPSIRRLFNRQEGVYDSGPQDSAST